MAFHVGPRVGAPVLSVVALSLFFCGCESRKKEERKPPEQELRPLLDPEAKARSSSRRCAEVAGGRPVTLRAGSQDTKSAVEVSNAVPVLDGFAVGVLTSGAETQAEVHFVDGRGRLQVAKLGRVHGSVDAPRVAQVGDEVIAVVVDNDAGHTRLRLAKLRDITTRPDVTWGPEVRVRRGETADFSVALAGRSPGDAKPPPALLVWDDFDKSRLSSQVMALSFDPASMQPQGKEIIVSPPSDDAVTPTVLSRQGGYYLVWLSYASAENQDDPAIDSASRPAPLVDGPPRLLRVLQLDDQGSPQGEPLSVSAHGDNVLVYQAAMAPSGDLLLAYRAAPTGRTEGATPVRLRSIGQDGSVTAASVGHEELGLGAPALLADAKNSPVWLTARGNESESLLGGIGEELLVTQFQLEAGLFEQIPLARRGDRLLVMEPDGLDLKLSVMSCAMSDAASARPNEATAQ